MKKLISNLITLILYAILLFMIVVVVSSKAAGGEPSIMGYQIKSVLSGSMEPTFMTGSIIAIKPTTEEGKEYKKGDVITFKKQENGETILVTHRILEATKSGDSMIYKTKGDNNDAPDLEPALSQNVVGKYANITIPYIGYFMSFANSKNGSLLLLVLPGILLLGYSAITIWQAISQIETKTKDQSAKV